MLFRSNASLAATYAVFGATNGTVALSGKTAQFNSTVSTNALASFLFKVTDNTGFSYTNTVNVRIIVPTTNTAPVLSAISNRAINVGVNLLITNTATDSDSPLQTLTYSLPVAPANATLGAASGILNWRPLVSQANSTNAFTVVVTDNGTPSMSATQNFNVIVNPVLVPKLGTVSLNGMQLSVPVSGGTVGPDYVVEVSTNLTGWQTLVTTNTPPQPFVLTDTNPPTAPAKFYRIRLSP